MLKGYRVRLFPTKTQEELMWKHVNFARFVFNRGLELRKKAYEQDGRTLTYVDQSAELTQFKRTPEGEFLKAVSAATLQYALKDLETSYINFFRRKKGFPKFKSVRTAKRSFSVKTDKTYFDSDTRLTLPTIGKVRYRSDYDLPQGRNAARMLNPRVALENGKWMLSFSLETQDPAKPELNDFSCGVDLGVKTLITCSYGGGRTLVVPNVNKERRVRRRAKRIRLLQRRMARSKRGSRRRERTRARLSRERGRVANIRRDHIHKATRRIVDLLPRKIVLEDLNVQGMVRNHHLARAVSECGFHEIRRQLEYKAEAFGIEVVHADRFYPSSKTCSSCGGHHAKLSLKDRTFSCPHCHASIDRDFNAALNLERYDQTCRGSLPPT